MSRVAFSSQRQLADALFRLLKTRRFKDISVSELCKEAGTSRQTFYTLFSSKENVVLFEIERRGEQEHDSAEAAIHQAQALTWADGFGLREDEHGLAQQEDEEAHRTRALSELCRAYAEFIHTNREMLTTLVQNDIIYLVQGPLRESLENSELLGERSPEVPRAYVANYLAGGITGIVRCYAEQGCVESVESLTQILEALFAGASR